MAIDNDILSIIDEEDKTAGLNTSINRATKGDAARSAEIIRLSETARVPRETVERNINEVKSQQRFDVVDPESIKKYNPRLAAWMTNPDNAAVAIDDVETLAEFESTLRNNDKPWYSLDIKETFKNFDQTMIESLSQRLNGMAIQGMDINYNGDMQSVKDMIAPYVKEISNLSINDAASVTIPKAKGYEEKTYIQKPTLNTLKPTMMLSMESDRDTFMRESADRLIEEIKASDIRIQELTPQNLSILEQGIRSGIESTVMQAPGLALSMMTGNPAFMLAPMVGMEYLGAYGEARAAGKNAADATVYAGVNSSIEYLTEKIPADKLMKLTGGGKLKDMFTKAGEFAISEIGGEQLATLGQSINSYMFDLDEQMANAKTFEERLAIQSERQAVTLFAALVGSGTQAGIGFTVGTVNNLLHKQETNDFNTVINHVAEQEKIDKVISLSQSLTMREHSPEKVKEFLDNEAGNSTSIFIPAAKIQELIDNGVEVPAVIADNIQAAVETGGDLEIGLGDFATLLAPNEELMAELRPHLRMKADSQSQSEFTDNNDSLKSLMEQAQKTEDIKTEADQIFQEIQDQLVATGRQSPATAKHSAAIIPAYATVKAQEHGIGVREVYEMMGLKIQGPATPKPGRQEGQILEQEYPSYKDAPVMYNEVRDTFLNALPENAEIEDVMEMVDTFSPEMRQVINQLNENDWLGFDYPAQALNALFSNEQEMFEISQGLKSAIGRLVNNGQTLSQAQIDDAVGALVMTNERADHLIANLSKDDRTSSAIIDMSPDQFLSLAAPSNHIDYEVDEKIASGEVDPTRGRLDENQLLIDNAITLQVYPQEDGSFKVTGHDGRHRAFVLRELGIENIPVVVTRYDYRDHQDTAGISEGDSFEPQGGLLHLTGKSTEKLVNETVGKVIDIKASNAGSILNEYGLGADSRGNVLYQSSIKLRSGMETLARYGLDPNGKHTVRDVAIALEERQRAKSGVIERGDYSEEAEKKVARWMAEEIKHEMLPENKDGSGYGWYTEKFQAALDELATIHPELKDKEQRDLMTLIIAVTSDGQKITSNLNMAVEAYEFYLDNGLLPVDQLAGGDRAGSLRGHMKKINALINDYGLTGMHEVLQQQMTVGELRQYAAQEGFEFKTGWKADTVMPFSAIVLGPKLGPFYANLMGHSGYLTIDRWLVRSVNRLRGTMLPKVNGLADNPVDSKGRKIGLARFKEMLGTPEMSDEAALIAVSTHWQSYFDKDYKNGTPIEKAANSIHKSAFREIQDKPYNASDREFIMRVFKRLQKNLKRSGENMSISDIQAILWYYEKRLYKELGTKQSADISYEEAAKKKTGAQPNRSKRSLAQSAIPNQEDGGPATLEQTPYLSDRLGFYLSPVPGYSEAELPGLQKLYKEAQNGDEQAARLLSDIARDALDYLTNGVDAEVKYTAATGIYQGNKEPSLGVTIEFNESPDEAMLAALAQFANNFNQQQIHVIETATEGSEVGDEYMDDSYNTSSFRYVLDGPLTAEQTRELLNSTALTGVTLTDEYLEAYYVGDPNNEQQIRDFETEAERLGVAIKGRTREVIKETKRLFVYGEGGIPFTKIAGELRTGDATYQNQTSLRIAARLAGRDVQPAPPKPITPEQFNLQAKIREAYEAMEDNALGNPVVRRAYSELAAEVNEQYAALPVKVEMFDGKGEPYANSDAMREDILKNNHLYIFPTKANNFGPKGMVYEDHPMLNKTGFLDINNTPMLVNDLFRAVHDYYAHTISNVQFGPVGEEAAWKNHMSMMKSPWARWALTSETRGQNSWVNFRDEVQNLPLAERGFAPQKVDLLPVEFTYTGDAVRDAEMDAINLEYDPLPTFYSQLIKVVKEKGQPKATVQQWLKLLEKQGVKKEEMHWLGVQEALDEEVNNSEENTISKDVFIGLLEERQVNIEIVNRGTSDADTDITDVEDQVNFSWGEEITEEPDADWISEQARDVWYDEKYEEYLDLYAQDEDYDSYAEIDNEDIKNSVEKNADERATEESEELAMQSYYQDPQSYIKLSVQTPSRDFEVHIGFAYGKTEIYNEDLGFDGGFEMNTFDRPEIEVQIFDALMERGFIKSEEQLEEEAELLEEENSSGIKISMRDRYGNSNWTLEGGKSYHESIITMPDQIDPYRPDTLHFTDEGGGTAVAWLRADLRDDGKTYFVQEFQSKRHMDGRKKGYVGVMPWKVYGKNNEVIKKFETKEEAEQYYFDNEPESIDWYVNDSDAGFIPDAPFKNTWQTLALKAAIRNAVQMGAERVTWTTGAMQADRYSLRKAVKSVSMYTPDYVMDKGWQTEEVYVVKAVDHQGYQAWEQEFKNPEDASEYIGKELTEKLISQLKDSDGATFVNAEDMKVGGEGLINLYDKMLPKIVDKYIKQFGSKVGVHKVDLDDTTAYMSITRQRMEEAGYTDNLSNPVHIITEMDDSVSGEFRMPDGTVHKTKPNQTREEVENELKEVWAKMFRTDVLGFDITPEMKLAALKGQALFQRKGEDRGNVIFGDETVINLFRASDLSTFLHESGHMFLEMESRFAAKYGVSENQRALLDWLGVESFTDIDISTPEGVELHEKFARGFERYLREGKAPTYKLRDAFSAFARWLKRIYQNVRMLDVEINDNIRQVFDRMLASEEEIALTRNNPAYDQFFKSQQQAGMTDEEWAAYEARQEKAKNRSEGTLDAKLIKELYRRKSKEWSDEKKPLIVEEKERLSREGIYQIMDNLKTEPLNRAQVLEVLGVKKIPGRLGFGKTKPDGVDIDVYAEAYGYTSGKQMLNEILTAETLSDAADKAAEARMIAKHGDILNDGSIEAEAREAVHNDEQAKLLLDELNIISRKSNKPGLNREQLKARAKDMIGAMKHGDIQPNRYYRNEIRAAQRAVSATTDAERIEAKTQQVINHYLYREAMETKERIDRWRKYIDAVKGRDYSATQVDPSYIQNMQLLARMYDMRKSPEKLKDLDLFLNWFISQTEVDNEFIKLEMMDENLVLAMEAKQRGQLAQYDFPSYKDLTAENLKGLYEMLRHLRYVGGQMADLEKAEFTSNRDAGVASIDDNGGRNVKRPDEPQKWDSWANAGMEFLLGNLHLRNLTRRLDGMKEDGWFYQNVYRPAVESANALMDLQEEYAVKYRDELDGLHTLSIGKNDKITRPKENGSEWTLSSEGRVMLALYWGTQSSREAIMAGHGVTEVDVDDMLSFMTEAELDLVNKIWKLNETLKPEIMGLAYRMYGASPVMLDPTPYMVNGVKMTGGHMRLFYGDNTDELDINEEKSYAGAPMSYSKPGTMHERVGSGGKMVLLDKSSIIRSLNENLHAITHAENFKKIARYINNRDIKDAIIRKHGSSFYKNLVAKIQSDMGFKRDVEVEKWWGKIARQVRQAATFKHLGFSIRNTVQQFSAVPIAGQEVGRGKLIAQFTKFASNPRKMVEQIHEYSGFMRHRGQTVNREATEQLGKISEDSLMNEYKEMSFITQTTIDSLNAYPTWMTKYENVMERLSKEALTEEDLQEAHNKAVADADLAVKESIGSGMDIDLGRLFSTKRAETTRMMTMFGSWFNAYANRIYRDYQRRANKENLTDDIEFKDYNFDAELMHTVATTPIIVGALNALLIWDGPDDDENVLLWLAKQYGSFMFALLPYVRELASAWQGFAQKTPVGVGAEAMTKLPKELESYRKGNQSVLKTGSDIGKAVTTFIQVPGSGQVFRMVDYWDSYEQGNEGSFDPFQMVLSGKTRN